MASGDLLASWGPQSNEPPASNFATPDVRNQHPCLDFDTSTQEAAVASFVMPGYYSGGSIVWKARVGATSATTGGIVFDGAIERVNDGQDTDSDSFDTAAQASALTAPATSGDTRWVTATMTSVDSVATGDLTRFRLRRVPADGGDTALGDAEVFAVALYEA